MTDETTDPRPPLVEFPFPNRDMVRAFLRDAGIPLDQIEAEASKVIMADALGRAIHAAKRIGGPWPAACVRPIQWDRRPEKDEDFEQVPYNYDSGEFECECEAMALHLVELMTAQAAVEGVKAASRIIMPPSVAREGQH